MNSQVMTKDGVLIARPSVTLDLNTNIKDVRALNGFKTTKVQIRRFGRQSLRLPLLLGAKP